MSSKKFPLAKALCFLSVFLFYILAECVINCLIHFNVSECAFYQPGTSSFFAMLVCVLFPVFIFAELWKIKKNWNQLKEKNVQFGDLFHTALKELLLYALCLVCFYYLYRGAEWVLFQRLTSPEPSLPEYFLIHFLHATRRAPYLYFAITCPIYLFLISVDYNALRHDTVQTAFGISPAS